MNNKYTDKQLAKKYGRRKTMCATIDHPPEFGYRCPMGHSNLDWSEFNDHIWCYECEKDYHYAKDCVLIKDKLNPVNLPEQPRIIKGISNWNKDGNGFKNIPKMRMYKFLKEHPIITVKGE